VIPLRCDFGLPKRQYSVAAGYRSLGPDRDSYIACDRCRRGVANAGDSHFPIRQVSIYDYSTAAAGAIDQAVSS